MSGLRSNFFNHRENRSISQSHTEWSEALCVTPCVFSPFSLWLKNKSAPFLTGRFNYIEDRELTQCYSFKFCNS